MCKHVAAVLYGVGAGLDERPELLFKLRKVDEKDLIARAGSGLPLSKKGPGSERVLATEGLSELFGLELATADREGRERRSPSKSRPYAGKRERTKAKRGMEIALGRPS